MSVVLIETYIVKSEKAAEFTPLLNEFLRYKKEHPDVFLGLKSWKLFKQEIGSPAGMYVELWEYESLADMEAINARIFGDAGMKAIQVAFHGLVEPATFSTSVWKGVA